MVTQLIPNSHVDYRLEAQILDEVRDLVQTIRIHQYSDGYTGLTSMRRCIELRRKRMSTVIGKRIARDLIKSKNPVTFMTEIIKRYLPELDKDEHLSSDDSGSEGVH